jgi:hypothetical protein
MTRPITLTFVDAADLRVVVGGVNALVATLNEWLQPTAWVWLDDQQPDRGYRLLTPSEWQELDGLGPGELRDALVKIPAHPPISVDQRPPSKRPSVVLDADGDVRGAWVSLERPVDRRKYLPPPGGPGIGRDRHQTGSGFRLGGRPDDSDSVRSGGPERDRPTVSAAVTGVPTLRRTPHLDVPPTIPTTPEARFNVSVYTDDQPFDEDESGGEVIVDAPSEVKRVRLTVTLITSEHFVVRGTLSRNFYIVRDLARSRPVIFTLEVAKEPPSTPAVITALFSYGGRVCGTVARTWIWDRTRLVRPGVRRTTTPTAPETLTIFTGAPKADLSVFVTANGDGLHYTSVVQTNLVPEFRQPSTGPWGLPQFAATMITSKLNALIDSKSTPAQRLEALETSGYEFWDAAPANFQDAFWKIIDSGRPLKSIYIASAEPSMPWELMTPFRNGQKQPLELPPLGVSYAIGRWCRNTADLTAAPPSLPVRDAFVVAPRYQTLDALDARAEVGLIRGRMRGRRLRNASGRTFDSYFLRHQASLLHFICHGASDVNNDDVMYLDDDEMLSSASLRSSKGLKAMCRARAPLVFINACSTGQRVPGLVGGAGFPLAFGDIGARAIIAPLWPVDSVIASKIAVELYDRALRPGSPPVAEILRTMRSRAYAGQDADSYAAYAFFGDPTARLELVS